MTVYHDTVELQSPLRKPMFHDITEQAQRAVKKSGVRIGTLTVYSAHTTCSVILQEEAHDTLYDGTKYLLQDLLDLFEQLAPTCRREGQYLHPGPEHIQHATQNLGEEATWSFNTEAHLRSSLLGRSETLPILDGEIELGEFGQIYFVDFDTVRSRNRKAHLQILGEA